MIGSINVERGSRELKRNPYEDEPALLTACGMFHGTVNTTAAMKMVTAVH